MNVDGYRNWEKIDECYSYKDELHNRWHEGVSAKMGADEEKKWWVEEENILMTREDVIKNLYALQLQSHLSIIKKQSIVAT